MFTVLLVDDEIWSLEGIRKLFEWEKMGFTVIDQVTDSSEALDIICSKKPDLVITDIRMPEISGLELLNMSRKQGIISEFVIISGFAEFEYAQEALRYGAFDYLLKPIDPGEAKELLEKLKLHLEEKRIANHNDIFKELTLGLNNPLEILSASSFKPYGEYWQVVALSGKYTIDNCELLSLFNDINHLSLRIGQEKTMIIMNGAQSLEKDTLTIIDKRAGGNGWCIGLSSVSVDIVHMERLIREADMAASHHFINEKPGINIFTTSCSVEIEGIIRKVEKLIMVKNYDEICYLINNIPLVFKNEDLGIYHVTCLWNQIVVMISKRLERDSFMTQIDFLDYEEIVHRFKNLSTLCVHIRELFKNICFPSGSGTVRSNSYNGNFIALLEHVNKNYDKELSLSDLAERFFLNMSYCSELFKKVTGYTFSDYLTKLRMETAVELIQSGKFTASRVCELTGYNDYYYFSKIFKKFHGVAPSQFAVKMLETSSPDVS